MLSEVCLMSKPQDFQGPLNVWKNSKPQDATITSIILHVRVSKENSSPGTISTVVFPADRNEKEMERACIPAKANAIHFAV